MPRGILEEYVRNLVDHEMVHPVDHEMVHPVEIQEWFFVRKYNIQSQVQIFLLCYYIESLDLISPRNHEKYQYHYS